jgi:hypothetical protein
MGHIGLSLIFVLMLVLLKQSVPLLTLPLQELYSKMLLEESHKVVLEI